MFDFLKGKKRKSKEEIEKERTERFNNVMTRLKVQEVETEKRKTELVKKIKYAQANGLTAQEQSGRKLLSNCIVMSKRIKGMRLNLEYSMQSREMASLTREFLSCLKDVGEDIRQEVAQTDAKAGKAYEKAMFALDTQAKILDETLETTEISMSEGVSDGYYSKDVNEEIDMLLGEEGGSVSSKRKVTDEI